MCGSTKYYYVSYRQNYAITNRRTEVHYAFRDGEGTYGDGICGNSPGSAGSSIHPHTIQVRRLQSGEEYIDQSRNLRIKAEGIQNGRSLVTIRKIHPSINPSISGIAPICDEGEMTCLNSNTVAILNASCYPTQTTNCGLGEICSNGICICANQCSPSGSRRCSGVDSYEVCGNYDSDSCLEWGGLTLCPAQLVCQSGNCVAPNSTNATNGTAYFTSSPEQGASVYSHPSGQWWGYTPFTSSFTPGAYTAKAYKYPLFQAYSYEQFTITSGQQTQINFALNQTHHAVCIVNATTNGTCSFAPGQGPTICGGIPIGGACASSFKVFVTSTTYNGNLGGVTTADAKCQERANTAGLGGNWKAWISDSTSAALNRLYHSNGPYSRLDNVIVADNWNDLVDDTLDAPINVDEYGNNGFTTFVWTGTLDWGGSATNNCVNWTVGSGAVGRVGRANSITSSWTSYSNDECNLMRGLYCFEQP